MGRHEGHMDNSRDLAFNADLEKIEERDSEAHSTMSVSKRSGRTDHTGITSSSLSRMPDFFRSGIFQMVLHNPTTAHQLLLFSQSRLCGENMEFLEKVGDTTTG
jgi:hypothetical protein